MINIHEHSILELLEAARDKNDIILGRHVSLDCVLTQGGFNRHMLINDYITNAINYANDNPSKGE